uniref:Phosphoglycerate mutase n=1 Tax=Parascaris equorum TaxID=6256 RepID=A0A914RS59_PAREQ
LSFRGSSLTSVTYYVSDVRFFQALYLCEDPPGYESLEILKQKYPLVDTSYDSARYVLENKGMNNNMIVNIDDCFIFVLFDFSGATLLLVSHGAPIGAIHELLGGNWKYVGQCLGYWEMLISIPFEYCELCI